MVKTGVRTQVFCPMFFHHVTYPLYTCIRIRPRAHTHVSPSVWWVSTYHTPGTTAPLWAESKRPDSDPGSAIKLLCELGPVIGY